VWLFLFVLFSETVWLRHEFIHLAPLPILCYNTLKVGVFIKIKQVAKRLTPVAKFKFDRADEISPQNNAVCFGCGVLNKRS
jgi:hypothetical protein